jgi:predicted negative regulator of RcsB-dependent stress response
MAQAKYEYENGDVESAIMHLRWASENATETDVRHVASLRLARILIAEEKYEEAETVLLAEHPAGFTAGYEELKGDLYAARGETAQARIAYDKAINAAEGSPSRWLILKRQDLGNGDLDHS